MIRSHSASRRHVLISFLIFAVTAVSINTGIRLMRRELAGPQFRFAGPTVAELERIGDLASTRIHVTDVLVGEGEGYRGSWLIKGDALLSCDLSKASIKNVNLEQRSATICLPRLRVLSPRVDHEKTKVWSVEKTTWLPWQWGDQGEMRDAAMFHAQKLVETAAGSQQHVTPAKAQAAAVIHRLYDFVQWKVDVEWE